MDVVFLHHDGNLFGLLTSTIFKDGKDWIVFRQLELSALGLHIWDNNLAQVSFHCVLIRPTMIWYKGDRQSSVNLKMEGKLKFFQMLNQFTGQRSADQSCDMLLITCDLDTLGSLFPLSIMIMGKVYLVMDFVITLSHMLVCNLTSSSSFTPVINVPPLFLMGIYLTSVFLQPHIHLCQVLTRATFYLNTTAAWLLCILCYDCLLG